MSFGLSLALRQFLKHVSPTELIHGLPTLSQAGSRLWPLSARSSQYTGVIRKALAERFSFSPRSVWKPAALAGATLGVGSCTPVAEPQTKTSEPITIYPVMTRFSASTPNKNPLCQNIEGYAAVDECEDQVDNDADGLTDREEDKDCSGAEFGITESPNQCTDKIDNDGDGLIDLQDPACIEPNSAKQPSLVTTVMNEDGTHIQTGNSLSFDYNPQTRVLTLVKPADRDLLIYGGAHLGSQIILNVQSGTGLFDPLSGHVSLSLSMEIFYGSTEADACRVKDVVTAAFTTSGNADLAGTQDAPSAYDGIMFAMVARNTPMSQLENCSTSVVNIANLCLPNQDNLFYVKAALFIDPQFEAKMKLLQP